MGELVPDLTSYDDLINGEDDYDAMHKPNQPLLKTLNLSAMNISYDEVMTKSKKSNWCPEKTLQHLLELESDHRREKKIESLIKQAGIPPQYTLETMDQKLLTPKLRKLLPALLEGSFVDRAENLLAFGLLKAEGNLIMLAQW